MSKQKIDSIKKRILPTLKKYDVVRASIFGSYARGEETKRSDIDVLVELSKKFQGFDYIRIRMDIQEELEKKLRKKVDLVEYDLIKPRLRKYILSNQSSLYP